MQGWTQSEIAALKSGDKRRIHLMELQLASGTWRASQSVRPITDAQARIWDPYGANGEVEGLGTGTGRRPREVTVILHGLQKGQSLKARIDASDPVGSNALIYFAWINAAEQLIVQPKLAFAGVVAGLPSIRLAQTDRVRLKLIAGASQAARLKSPWDATPASHQAYAGVVDPIYNRVTSATQQAEAL